MGDIGDVVNLRIKVSGSPIRAHHDGHHSGHWPFLEYRPYRTLRGQEDNVIYTYVLRRGRRYPQSRGLMWGERVGGRPVV